MSLEILRRMAFIGLISVYNFELYFCIIDYFLLFFVFTVIQAQIINVRLLFKEKNKFNEVVIKIFTFVISNTRK